MIWTSDENEVRKIGENVCDFLKKLNDEANVPYDLTVCIGISKADKTRDVKDVIEEADKKLYEEKRKI
jgi:PleD family two-component response regulator